MIGTRNVLRFRQLWMIPGNRKCFAHIVFVLRAYAPTVAPRTAPTRPPSPPPTPIGPHACPCLLLQLRPAHVLPHSSNYDQPTCFHPPPTPTSPTRRLPPPTGPSAAPERLPTPLPGASERLAGRQCIVRAYNDKNAVCIALLQGHLDIWTRMNTGRHVM